MSLPKSLKDFQVIINTQIERHFADLGPETFFRKACSYAMLGGGKRIRPLIVLSVADSLGFDANALPAALSVEMFHAASLVGDDMPCMDDADERRKLPSTHKKFGEMTALLVSYALIAEGYGTVAKNSQLIKEGKHPFSDEGDLRGRLALENASFNTGVFGATGGQFLDLTTQTPSEAALKEIIAKKTSSLFEVAFVYGWLFGGGALAKLNLVKEMAQAFGMAFQLVDDLGDVEEDQAKENPINWACSFGVEATQKQVEQELFKFKDLGNGLGLENSTSPLAQYLEEALVACAN